MPYLVDYIPCFSKCSLKEVNSLSLLDNWMKSLMHVQSLVAQLVKNQPAMQETLVQFLGREDPLEKGYPLQYSGLENSMESMGSQRVEHN